MNSLYKSLNQNNQPRDIFSQINQIQAEVQKSGLTPEQYFNQEIQKKGVDPKPILDKAQQMANMFKMM